MSATGILCAFGSSVALVAALLWWHLSHPNTNARITLQTLGLGLAGQKFSQVSAVVCLVYKATICLNIEWLPLAGLCLVVRTLLEYFFGRLASGHELDAGTAIGAVDGCILKNSISRGFIW